ncbi:MAG: hypothetical protein KAS17_05310 [Victivallaceae bacterium]|nr:hypothetical protein [Victivallaceae bacterium]
MKKKIWKTLIGLLVLIVIIIVVLVMYLGSIIAEATRTFGTRATGTKVAVESVSVSLLSGDLAINKLSIDNPPDYKTKQAFSFDLVSVDLDVNSIFSDTIIINKIEIANVKIDFEPTLQGGSNLTDIKNNIMKFAQGEEADAKKETEPEADDEAVPPKKAKKVIIKSFIINKGEIRVSSSMLKTSAAVPLARMELNDIAKESEMGEAVSEIFNEIVKSVVEAVASADVEGLKLDVISKDLPDAAEKIAKDISKSIKDLF